MGFHRGSGADRQGDNDEKGETASDIITRIISGYRRDGYFKRIFINGTNYDATEAVFFINEVKTIFQIIKANNLQSKEVTVLISASNKYASKKRIPSI